MPSRANTLQKMGRLHDEILEWLLRNPDRTQADCACSFGISETWMSRIVNSDAFQAAYRERADERKVLTLHTIQSQLAGITSLAMTKAEEKLVGGASEKFVHDVMKTGLSAAGFGNEAPVQVHQHVHVSPEVLERARERTEARRRGSTPEKLEHSETPPASVPALATGGGG